MHEVFRQYVEPLHSRFERLLGMSPVKIASLPKNHPQDAVYLFSEDNKHWYVGRTRRLRNRLQVHSRPSSKQNQASFAYRLACEATGRTKAAYTTQDSRESREGDPRFNEEFIKAKARIRDMDVRFVEETDSCRQALLEIYTAVVLNTKYNDFKTH